MRTHRLIPIALGAALFTLLATTASADGKPQAPCSHHDHVGHERENPRHAQEITIKQRDKRAAQRAHAAH